MAVIAQVKENEQNNSKPFPKLMVADDGDIVYFQKAKVGMLVYSETGRLVPDFSQEWSMQFFTDFTGELTLKNQ